MGADDETIRRDRDVPAVQLEHGCVISSEIAVAEMFLEYIVYEFRCLFSAGSMGQRHLFVIIQHKILPEPCCNAAWLDLSSVIAILVKSRACSLAGDHAGADRMLDRAGLAE